MPDDVLKVTYDKFTFLVPQDLLYSDAGLWVKREGDRVRFGLTDFAQQQSGDVAFAKAKPAGTWLERGDELAEIETVKVNVSFPSPVAGTVVEVNASLETEAERINQDPYGRGWLAMIAPEDWDKDREPLLDAARYFALVKLQAEAEMRK